MQTWSDSWWWLSLTSGMPLHFARWQQETPEMLGPIALVDFNELQKRGGGYDWYDAPSKSGRLRRHASAVEGWQVRQKSNRAWVNSGNIFEMLARHLQVGQLVEE
jgi:hypothetical protein